MKNKKLVYVTFTVVLLGALFALGAWMYKSEQKKELSQRAGNTEVFVRPYSHKQGPDSASVILVEFLDPECESCREFYPLVKSIMNEFEGKVQLVVRYAAFHGNSKFAIKILEAAGKQSKYWETLALLFQHQPEWGSHHNPQPELIWNYLPSLGLDIEKLKADMEDPSIMKNLEQDTADGQTLMVRGTPSFFVNGKPLENFGYEPLRQMVAQELQK
jgi:protein-disulfide isomerase